MKKILAMLCVISLMLLSGCGISEKLVLKKYTAKGEFIVSSGSIDDDYVVTSSELDEGTNFVRDFFESDGLINEIHKNLELDISVEELKETISFETDEGSYVISVIVETDSQEKSDKILDCIFKVLPEYAKGKIPGRIAFLGDE
ncbi:MAG: hypothetical protein IJA44_01605 [Clostridia bacterium]|nr:hypothetical protein [Clostridia bacterium]